MNLKKYFFEEEITKKAKILSTLFLIVLIIVMSFSFVSAHNVDLDPESLISFPWIITNGKGAITVSDNETGYSLYYQVVEIPQEDYAQIEEIQTNSEQNLEQINEKLTQLTTECNDLRTIYNDAYDAYQEKIQSGASDEEIAEAKQAFETAETNYENKVVEYNDCVTEYNNEVINVTERIKELTPTYVEENWIETSNGDFTIDLSQFSGDKAFAVWAKLVTSDGNTYFDECTYTTSGTKVENVLVESITLNRTELNMTVGSEYELVAEVNPSDASNKTVIWSSDDENVVKVENGKVTAIAEGTATITAVTQEGGHTATCRVTVTKGSNDTNSTVDDDKKQDPTVSDSALPDTGNISFIVILAIASLVIIGIVVYKRNKYLNIK